MRLSYRFPFSRFLRRHLVTGLAAVAALSITDLSAQLAQAQTADDFPSKTIRFVVPYAAGGPLDAAARQLAEHLREHYDETVVVENSPGAGGNIGLSAVARARPDGHTLGMGAVATMAINPWLYPSMPFDPTTDLSPIILLSNVPNVLILNKDFAQQHQISDVDSLVAFLKEHGADINYSSGGNGSAGHLAGELLKTRTGADMLHIPYQGANPAKLALMANQTQLMFDNLASALPLIQSGDVVALAVTSPERSSFLPNLPTMQESGVADFDITTWFGVVAPAGTPEAIIHSLHNAYAQGMQNERVQFLMQSMGSDLVPGTVDEFTEFAKDELQKYKTIIESAGIKFE